jgi:hypothetical protein
MSFAPVNLASKVWLFKPTGAHTCVPIHPTGAHTCVHVHPTSAHECTLVTYTGTLHHSAPVCHTVAHPYAVV